MHFDLDFAKIRTDRVVDVIMQPILGPVDNAKTE